MISPSNFSFVSVNLKLFGFLINDFNFENFWPNSIVLKLSGPSAELMQQIKMLKAPPLKVDEYTLDKGDSFYPDDSGILSPQVSGNGIEATRYATLLKILREAFELISS